MDENPQLLYSVASAARRLGIGRTLMYDQISSGRIRTVKVGKRRLIPADALLDFVADLEADSSQQAA